jgi:peptidoglycan/LPS O-acetylase OafA/YrhL
MRYRPHIDGLRAVAIIPVVLMHADVALFAGGFTGVDVFFVISGFLISSLIVEEIGRGRFTVGDFYKRRALL